jgi:glycerol-3-phosphate acyltransferase PlsY
MIGHGLLVILKSAVVGGAYLLGSVPFGYVISRYLYGVDITTLGSKNIGATNVYRNLGWGAGFLTFAGDMGKGILPVLAARQWDDQLQWAALVGLAAVVGHCYSVFLRFRGGKGVATTLAVLLALSPTFFLLYLVVLLTVLLFQGRVSLASLSAAAAGPMLVELVPGHPAGIFFFSWVTAVVIFVRHQENVDRLLKGQEKQIFTPSRLFGD